MKKKILIIFFVSMIFYGCSSKQYIMKENEIPISINLYPKIIELDSINQEFIFSRKISNVSKHSVKLLMIGFDYMGIQDSNASGLYPSCITINGKHCYMNFGPYHIKEKIVIKANNFSEQKIKLNITELCWKKDLDDSKPIYLILKYSNDRYSCSDTITIRLGNVPD